MSLLNPTLDVPRDPTQRCAKCCVTGAHTTETHDQALANPQHGLARETVARMTVRELALHMPPCSCPGCELCTGGPP